MDGKKETKMLTVIKLKLAPISQIFIMELSYFCREEEQFTNSDRSRSTPAMWKRKDKGWEDLKAGPSVTSLPLLGPSQASPQGRLGGLDRDPCPTHLHASVDQPHKSPEPGKKGPAGVTLTRQKLWKSPQHHSPSSIWKQSLPNFSNTCAPGTQPW